MRRGIGSDTGPDLVDIGVNRLIHETAKAWLFDIDGEEVWIPKSTSADFHQGDKVLTVERWIAHNKGLV